VVEHPDVEAVRQVDRVLRAADVDLRVALGVGGHVVDRREVEEVVDLRQLGLDAEVRQREIADHRLDPVGLTPTFDERRELLARALADKDVDVAFTLEQALDQMASDEARGSSDEVGRQRSLPP
jgi:hypothetical protein